MECREKKIYVDGYWITAIPIPAAITDMQVILTNDIGEVMSVLFITSDDKVIWKFGKPAKDWAEKVENALIRKFAEG